MKIFLNILRSDRGVKALFVTRGGVVLVINCVKVDVSGLTGNLLARADIEGTIWGTWVCLTTVSLINCEGGTLFTDKDKI